MAEAPNLLLAHMREVLAVAEAALDTTPPGRVLLMPGANPVWDDCCESGGQLWVRVMNVVPATGKPPKCPVLGWRATLGIGVIRCAHVVDDHGYAPTAEQMSGDTVQMTQDMADVGRALLCSGLVSTVTNWLPAGPDGGCVGGEWTVTVTYDWCGCNGWQGNATD